MKRILTLLLVVALAAGAWYGYTRWRDNRAQPQQTYTLGRVGRMTVESTVTAIGSLLPERQQVLSLAGAGTTAEVLVAQDDSVTAGQVLLRLDPRDVEQSIAQARAALAVSEATLARSRKPASAEDIASAEAAVDSARANLADLEKGASSRDKQLARLSIDQAKNSLYGAQASRDSIKGSPMSSPGQVASAEAQVLNAELAVKIAELNYGKLFEPVRESQLRAAETQIAQAEATLARLKAQPSADDLAVYEAQVAQARLSVEAAERRQEDLVFTAPFAGKLASWSLHVGDRATPGAPIGTLLDDSRYHIDLSIDETDIPRIVEGSVARITLDAYPDQQLAGRVSSVGLLGSNVAGIVNYSVRIDIESAGLELRPLMTASVEIVIETRANALVVPNRALRRDAEGKFVELLQGGQPVKQYVVTGVASNEYTEVLSGLDENQEIIIAKPREIVLTSDFFGG